MLLLVLDATDGIRLHRSVVADSGGDDVLGETGGDRVGNVERSGLPGEGLLLASIRKSDLDGVVGLGLDGGSVFGVEVVELLNSRFEEGSVAHRDEGITEVAGALHGLLGALHETTAFTNYFFGHG